VTIGGARHNSQIYLVNPDGGAPVRVTHDDKGGPRGGTNIDPSWHPDGKYLLFIGCPASFCVASSYEVYRINIDGSGETRLTNDEFADYDPYYAPSGREIAWLRRIDATRFAIYRMHADDRDQRAVIDDGGINSKPAWRIDGAAIVFHRIPPHSPRGSVFNIWQVGPDGKGLTEIIKPRPSYSNEYPEPGMHRR
jgi:Tol biopolymer transport system component